MKPAIIESAAERSVPPTIEEPTSRAIGTGRVSHRLLREVLPAAAAYLALSLVVWWGLWSTSGHTTCGCGDSSTFIWYIEWPAYAIAHGLNPFYSTALFHPGGIDLLSNTSVPAVGIALAPITGSLALLPLST